ncbi:hypothetical protein [Amycolatopsis pithecellobii]|uniref:Uncharacterized protein n=1 Tax=Amycolatopsis pithecellobii TaxID=664692 RepID=A0A6N7Z3C5_9PSEU|nr:hypothetical protein [Amycolatopsis pithecellobii]MTD54711.1 hypothetical protein [Amycolatopsis pithecellobii]
MVVVPSQRPDIGHQIELPVLGEMHLPPPNRLAYFAGLGVLAAFGVVEWPLAVVVAAGHLLADQHWSQVVSGLGESLEEA